MNSCQFFYLFIFWFKFTQNLFYSFVPYQLSHYFSSVFSEQESPPKLRNKTERAAVRTSSPSLPPLVYIERFIGRQTQKDDEFSLEVRFLIFWELGFFLTLKNWSFMNFFSNKFNQNQKIHRISLSLIFFSNQFFLFFKFFERPGNRKNQGIKFCFIIFFFNSVYFYSELNFDFCVISDPMERWWPYFHNADHWPAPCPSAPATRQIWTAEKREIPEYPSGRAPFCFEGNW